jgi:hypothetical protein
VRLFVCHVPRTGGSSLIASLTAVLGDPVGVEPLVDGFDWLHDPSSPYHVDRESCLRDARGRLDASLPDARLYRGHVPASLMTGRGVVVVSCVRNPVTRAASAYLFARYLGHIPPTMTAVEFVSLPHRRNVQSSLTRGAHVLGVYERYDRFVRDVGAVVGRELPPVRENVGPSRERDELVNDPAFVARVRDVNRDDVALWESLDR